MAFHRKLRWCNPTDFYIRKSKISGYFYELLPNILLFAPLSHEFFMGKTIANYTQMYILTINTIPQ